MWEKKGTISVLRNLAPPQADGELKNSFKSELGKKMHRNSELPCFDKYLHLLLVPLVQAKKWIDFCVYI